MCGPTHGPAPHHSTYESPASAGLFPVTMSRSTPPGRYREVIDEVDAACRSSDWVHVTAGVAHWHGAAPDDTFVHLAVTATGGTVWHDPVDDDAYRRATVVRVPSPSAVSTTAGIPCRHPH